MLTAKQARDRVTQSKANIDRMLGQLEKLIVAAADLGKNEIILHYTTHIYGDEFRLEKKPFYPTEFTPFQLLVKEELEKHGYGMSMVVRKVQIGGGLGSMDDEVHHEDRDFIRISW